MIRISPQAGADVKENLKNWAKQQEAELAEAWAIVFGFVGILMWIPTWWKNKMGPYDR